MANWIWTEIMIGYHWNCVRQRRAAALQINKNDQPETLLVMFHICVGWTSLGWGVHCLSACAALGNDLSIGDVTFQPLSRWIIYEIYSDFGFQQNLDWTLNFSVANQVFQTSSIEDYVIVGNDALMKCIIPSFVTDWVSVVGWEDSQGQLYHRDSPTLGIIRPC